MLDVTTDYSAWLPFRVLPPREASNEDLAALKPLYVELLQDPARIFDDVLDGSATADDGRAVLLTPWSTRCSRAERAARRADWVPRISRCTCRANGSRQMGGSSAGVAMRCARRRTGAQR